MSSFSLLILLLHTYILLMYCLLFGLCIEMPSYVVYKGKVPGVYDDWEECRRQVHRFSGNSYKGYTTRAEEESRYARYLAGERRERCFPWPLIEPPALAIFMLNFIRFVGR